MGTKPALNKPNIFDNASDLPVLDAQAAARQAYKERSREELEALDRLAETITLADINNLVIGGMRFTPTGLVPVEEITEDGLKLVGDVLHRFKVSYQWLVGDWLAHANVYEWADMETVAAYLRLSVQTLKNWKAVSTNVPQYLRKYRLDYGHFALVAFLPEDGQNSWLQLAEHGDLIPGGTGERRRWSVARLRKEMMKQKITPPALPGRTEASRSKNLRKIARKTLNLDDSRITTMNEKGRAEHLGYIRLLRDKLDELEQRLKGESG